MSELIMRVLIFLFFLSFCNGQEGPIVQIRNGKIKGVKLETEKKKVFYAFRGIPYAKPPVGDLRFEAPQPPDNWSNVLETVNDASACAQRTGTGKEDCLYLNVYTPKLPSDSSSKKSLLPVMVWIHGGGFFIGSSWYDGYGPDYLIEQDVVFVSLNYRLGVLGFLSLGDSVVPGNNGLKDQNMALKWVVDNIKNFGGNPNQITLFGQSAGSASVTYHLQSPLSRGLFQRAIMESGSSFCLWSYSRIAPEIAKKVAKSFNIDVSSSESIKKGLKKVNVTELLVTALKINRETFLTYEHNPLKGFLFAPVLEKNVSGSFVIGKSHELIESGNFHQVPVMMGYNSLELYVADNIAEFFFPEVMGHIDLVPIDMNIKDNSTKISVNNAIKEKYFGSDPHNFTEYNKALFLSDDLMLRPVQQYARMLSKFTKAYFYKFSYMGQLNRFIASRPYPGVYHSEEMDYIFRTSQHKKANERDALTRARTVKLWTNFAKHSNPTPEPDDLLQNQIWSPIDGNSKNLDYFEIDKNVKSLKNPNDDMYKFWNKLYTEYGKPPYDTY